MYCLALAGARITLAACPQTVPPCDVLTPGCATPASTASLCPIRAVQSSRCALAREQTQLIRAIRGYPCSAARGTSRVGRLVSGRERESFPDAVLFRGTWTAQRAPTLCGSTPDGAPAIAVAASGACEVTKSFERTSANPAIAPTKAIAEAISRMFVSAPVNATL